MDWAGHTYGDCGVKRFVSPNGHIGLRFKIGTDYHYGWMRLQQTNCGGGGVPKVYLRGYAYESVAEGPIYAGDLTYVVRPMVAEIRHNAAMITWNHLVGIDHFEIQHRQVGELNWTSATLPAGVPESHMISGLLNNTEFEYKMIGYYDSTETQSTAWSAIDAFATICQMPENLEVAVFGPQHVKLKWEDIPGAIDGYKLFFRELGTSSWNIHDVPGGQSEKHFYGLQAGTTYQWMVRSMCKQAFYIYSFITPIHAFTTDCAMPVNAWEVIQGPHKVNLKWTAVAGASAGYEINARRFGVNGWKAVTVPAGTTNRQFRYLTENESYQWKVRALCNGQFKVYSPFTSVRTFVLQTGNRLGSGDAVFNSSDEQSISIYQSANQAVMVRFPESKFAQEFELTVLDAMGRTVEAPMSMHHNELKIETGELAQGVYVLAIYTGEFLYSEKFVVQH